MGYSLPGPRPSLSLGVCSNLCPLSQWCYLTISSYAAPSSCPRDAFPSIRVFSSKSALPIRWPQYWSFSLSISPSNEYSRLISFRIDWFNLLAVQGTLKSLLQHHKSKASILRCTAFFMVQLSHLYMTTGKTIVLTTQTFVGKVMSLLFSLPAMQETWVWSLPWVGKIPWRRAWQPTPVFLPGESHRQRSLVGYSP